MSANLLQHMRELKDLRLTVKSIAVMLGWANVPPRETLEASLRSKRERLERVEAENARLVGILNSPELHDFTKAVALEAAHQRDRWKSEHDAGKTPADWFWLVGYLAGKALHAHAEGRLDKALHHAITTAAALANWHAAILGSTNMRPGIAPPKEATR